MRARNIKPSFFKNEHLSTLPPLTRLLFIALWCIADREGRLEDRPARIKAEAFPYDDCDIEAMLESLTKFPEPFIIRYEVEGKGYIQVVTAGDHFNPHPNEKDSEFPSISSGIVKSNKALVKSYVPLKLNPDIMNPESCNTITPPSQLGNKPVDKSVDNLPSKETDRAKRKIFIKPTIPEIEIYARSIGFKLNAKSFVDYYEARGWQFKSGQPMKDWKATVRNWKTNEEARNRASNVGKSIFDQANELRRQQKTDGPRKATSIGEILNGVRGMPVVQPEPGPDPGL